MDESLQNLCESVLKEARIPLKNKKAFNFFLNAGDEPVFFGYSTMGGIAQITNSFIGLPWSFQYKSVDELNPDEIGVFVDYQVPWSSPRGKLLLDSLIFSDSAKKFATMRQIHMANSYGLHFHTFNVVLVALIYSALSKYQNTRLVRLAKLPSGYNMLLKLIKLAICATIFYFIRDAIRHAIEARSDLKAVETGDEYYEGAVEYYSKILQRNKALAFFLGDEGKKYYTSAGDPRPPFLHWLLKPIPIPPDTRLRMIQERFAHFESKDEPIL